MTITVPDHVLRTTATFTNAWHEFWAAVRARVDPEIKLQKELDKLHEQYREERARRFERYEHAWKVRLEEERAKVTLQKQAEADQRKSMWQEPRRVSG